MAMHVRSLTAQLKKGFSLRNFHPGSLIELNYMQCSAGSMVKY